MRVPRSLPHATSRIQPEDPAGGFRCGVTALDEFFARYAAANDRQGIGTTYVMRSQDAVPPPVLGFYTLSMAAAQSEAIATALATRLPRYPLPVALIGRLAVDERVRGRRIGERLLMDALRRVVDLSDSIGCMGVIVDAKDQGAERFYGKYDFTAIETQRWPRRMFLPIQVARAALVGRA